MLATDYRHHHGAGTAVPDRVVAGKVPVAEGRARRSSRSGKLGSAGFPIVTSAEFRRARLAQRSFSGVITSLPEHQLVEICEHLLSLTCSL